MISRLGMIVKICSGCLWIMLGYWFVNYKCWCYVCYKLGFI